MNDDQAKRKMKCDIDLVASKRTKKAVPVTDYNNCILCQHTSGTLHRVQTSTQEKLLVAMEARLDTVAERLVDDVKGDNWLTNEPKWHPKCRNLYINEKSYKLVERTRSQANTGTVSSAESASCSSEVGTRISVTTRSRVQTFEAKTTCVICGNQWHKHRRPTSKVTTNEAPKKHL